MPEIDASLSNLTPDQAMILQQIQTLGMLHGYSRPTIKRRKPVKWEAWEEKNLIEGVRRFGRGNWAQIRAAFEFQPCRTNVDLHDKWRVLTGERKRARVSVAPRVDDIMHEARRAVAQAIGVETPDSSPSTEPKSVPPGCSNGTSDQPQESNGTSAVVVNETAVQSAENVAEQANNLLSSNPLALLQYDNQELMSSHEFLAQMQALQEGMGIQLPTYEELMAGVTGAAAAVAPQQEQPQPEQAITAPASASKKRSKKSAKESEVAQELLKLAQETDEHPTGAETTTEDEHESAAAKKRKVTKKTARKSKKSDVPLPVIAETDAPASN